MSWSRLHVADVHRGDHRSKLAIMRWIVPMIKIILSITLSLGGSGVGHSRRDHEGLVFCADRLCRATTRWMSARSKIITSRSGDHWESVTRGPAWEKAALAATASTCLAPLGLTPRRGSAHRHRAGKSNASASLILPWACAMFAAARSPSTQSPRSARSACLAPTSPRLFRPPASFMRS